MISLTVFIAVIAIIILIAYFTIRQVIKKGNKVNEENIIVLDKKYQDIIAAKDNYINELKEPTNPAEMSDGWHTFEDLYNYRMIYNAGLVNCIIKLKKELPITFKEVDIIKSKKHFGGEPCYNGEYFIVVIKTPFGQISNHYKLEHWDKFNCRATKTAWKYDGHNMEDSINRLNKLYKFINTGSWV